MDSDLAARLKYLRLGNLLSRWDEYLKLAQRPNCSMVKLLGRIIEDEYEVKQQNARVQRLKRARIPEPLVMET